MNLSLLSANKEITFIILLIFGLLTFATILFYIWGIVKPETNLIELKIRTKSWWSMAFVFIIASIIHPVISYFAFGLLSFMALRELASISKNVREEDRRIIIWCYLSIPVQYIIAYYGLFNLFVIFIPVIMFIWLPFMLVIKGSTNDISKSMSVLPTQLMLTVFSLSHLAFLLSLPHIQGFNPGGKGLLLFIVFMTEINDVFQFTWGKILGRHKIIPKISPNKTWEGFIGGILTTTLLGYYLRFLTPFSPTEALIISFIIGCSGFIGDIVVSAVRQNDSRAWWVIR